VEKSIPGSACRHDNGLDFGDPWDAGSDVTVFVLDTGIQVEHSEFDMSIEHGARQVECDREVINHMAILSNNPNDDGKDRHGHGTHCAGSVGGARVGMAPCANIRSIKVMNDEGSGQYSDIIAGGEEDASVNDNQK